MDLARERRSFRRVKADVDIKIDLLDQPGITGGFHVGKGSDISACGVMMTYSRSFDVNRMIRVMFLCPNSFDFFSATARVVRVETNPANTYSIAVEFSDLSEEEKRRLDYYLTY